MKAQQQQQVITARTQQDSPPAATSTRERRRQETTASAKFAPMLKDGELRMNLDNVSAGEYTLVGTFISNAVSVDIVHLESNSWIGQIGTPRPVVKPAPTNKANPAKTLLKAEAVARMRLSQAFLYSPDVTIRGLSELLVKSEVLKVLELVRINFNGEAIAYLAEGLKANRSLNAIRFRSCAFGPEKDFDLLAISLGAQITLETVEMTNCGLTDSASPGVREIINGHTARRNEIVWVCGLRGEAPKANSDKQGLAQLILSKNHLSDQFVADLMAILHFDQYLRLIDLSDNGLKGAGVESILDWMDSCSNIVGLDLSGNPGYTDLHHKRLLQSLIKNIKKLRGDRHTMKRMLRKKWIAPELLASPSFDLREEAKLPDPRPVVKKTPRKKPRRPAHNNKRSAGSKDRHPKEPEAPATERPPQSQFQFQTKVAELPQKQLDFLSKRRNTHEQSPIVLASEDCRSVSYSGEIDCADDGIRVSNLAHLEVPCKVCGKYFKELMQSESRCLALSMENKVLKRQLRVQQMLPAQISALSGIHPMAAADPTTTLQQHESISLINQANNTSTVFEGV